MNKKIPILLLASVLLAGCSGSGDSGSNNEVETIKYTVIFANTDLSNVQVEQGKALNKPADPSKANSVFTGWYSDENLSQEVTFPLTINGNTTIYAGFYSYQDAFKKARNNTIGDNVVGYEYDYTLDVSAGYMAVALKGHTEGNSKYNPSSTDVTFYDEHTNSGALFYDGSKYTIKKGNDLHEISLDENDTIKKYNISNVGADYKFDSSSFAKALFEYDDTKLKEIKPTTTKGEYQLKTGFNASSGISLIGNYINHPMVEKIVGELPETSVDTGMYVTFDGDKINSYRYTMSIDVTGIKFTLTYNLSFKNAGRAPTITPKVFNNTYVSNTDVNNAKTEIVSYINAYKSLEHSSYDFLVKTAVDYAHKNAINATLKGFTKRKVTNTEVYYLNDYKVDTDHKNADLYKAKGLGDCHGGRVKLSNGEVHDLKDKLIGGYSDVKTVSDPGTADDFYLFDVLGMIDKISFIQKKSDVSKNKVEYAIGSDNNGAVKVLKAFNDMLRLNPLGECSVDVKAFGDFIDSSVTVKNFKFVITVVNNALSEIRLDLNGKLKASFPESRDFEEAQDAGYKLSYSLKVTDKASDFEPAASVDKVK